MALNRNIPANLKQLFKDTLDTWTVEFILADNAERTRIESQMIADEKPTYNLQRRK